MAVNLNRFKKASESLQEKIKKPAIEAELKPETTVEVQNSRRMQIF